MANAPPDDEPLSGEDVAALDEAKGELQAGNTVSHEDFKRELGL